MHMAINLRFRFSALVIFFGVFIGFLGAVPGLSLGQSGTISGKVTDATTGESLPGASILVKGTTIGAATDHDGTYSIPYAPAGRDSLLISYIGYHSQVKPVTVKAGETVTVNFELTSLSVQGQEVVVSVQATGQKQAINQQLSSNTIENVVSESRIRALPDVNAAESVGRLPGVSIERSGGEAQKVAIRGLSPKYNVVTVNGVKIPATGGSDRSVNLSIISSNMLDGITLKKVVTPDMDADVLGGTVDLKLKEAPDSLDFGASIQGGYNKLKSFYGNYKFDAHLSDRFFRKRLGIIASFNADQFNRSANIYSGSYYYGITTGTNEGFLGLQNVTLRENNVVRSRIGGSVLFDYRIPLGKITLNSFYNRLDNNSLNHINQIDVEQGRHYVQLVHDPQNINSIFTGALGFEKNLKWVQIDASVSRSVTVGKDPSNYSFEFDREGGVFLTLPTQETEATDIPGMVSNAIDTLRLENMYHNSLHRNEHVTGTKLNLKFPFHLNDEISGYFKTGGELHWLDRTNNQEQVGRSGMQYNNPYYNAMAKVDPELQLDTLYKYYQYMPMAPFSNNYYRPNFLEGEFGSQPLSFAPRLSLMRRLYNDLAAVGDTVTYSIPSLGNDYSGKERYEAAYVMAELDLGPHITFLPGIRYEYNYTRYNGERFREITINNSEGPPGDLKYLTSIRRNQYWLPMFQLKIKPVNWFDIRLARTETLTRPDFIQYAPISHINSYQSYARAANSQLKPAKATNYDAALSIYENHLGLFTADVFYKDIEDLIFQTRYYLGNGITPLPGMHVPSSWYHGATPTVDTYQNNPYKTTYKGFELSWQTNFWYLPSVLKGLVLNVNFTRIFSKTHKHIYDSHYTTITFPPPPRSVLSITDTSITVRMPDQPKYIANMTIGYDFHGFSARLSYLYQTDQVSYISDTITRMLDQYTGGYYRWDLALKQNLPMGFQIFANLNNLNNRRDHSYQGDSDHPTYVQDYGFTVDIGLRYQF